MKESDSRQASNEVISASLPFKIPRQIPVTIVSTIYKLIIHHYINLLLSLTFIYSQSQSICLVQLGNMRLYGLRLHLLLCQHRHALPHLPRLQMNNLVGKEAILCYPVH